MSDDLRFSVDFQLVQRCLEGEVSAIKQLRETYGPIVTAYLRQAGADESEAEEVTEFLWADCLAPRQDRGPRLATYAGQASLKSWFHTVALNRLIARKRRRGNQNLVLAEDTNVDEEEVLPGGAARAASEVPLIELMRDAVEAGFRECAAEDFVLLHLAHIDRLHVMELAKMFACSKSKIDRDIDLAEKRVAEATLRYIRNVDPWLELTWDDFMDLCRVASPACFGME